MSAFGYNPAANTDDGSCGFFVATINGCTFSNMFNYSPYANVDDGSCIAVVEGCMDSSAENYSQYANTEDYSCTYPVSGCSDESALNYSQYVTLHISVLCIEKVFGCQNPNYFEFDSTANVMDFSMCITPIIEGCTDSTALNYSANSTLDDGSCEQAVKAV